MTVSELITQILRRLNELDPLHPVRWSRDEILVFVNDALAELNLIAWLYQATVTDAINSTDNVYEFPEEVLGPISIHVLLKYLLRSTVSDLDAETRWETASNRLSPQQWAPLGLNRYVITPRPLADTTVSITAVTHHTLVEDDDTALSLAETYQVILEDFCLERAQFKEGGAELAQAGDQYKEFLDGAQQISGRSILRGYPRYTSGEPDTETFRARLEEK